MQAESTVMLVESRFRTYSLVLHVPSMVFHVGNRSLS